MLEGYYVLVLVYNGGVVAKPQRNNQRESQVPASAVIPALRVYDNVAAVKTFVAHIGGVFVCTKSVTLRIGQFSLVHMERTSVLIPSGI